MTCRICGRLEDRQGRTWLKVEWRDAVCEDLGEDAPMYTHRYGWKPETKSVEVLISPSDKVYVVGSRNAELTREIGRSISKRIKEIRRDGNG